MLATSTVQHSPSKPAWQTEELEDEWVEPSSSHHSDHTPPHSLSIVSNGRFQDIASPSPTLSRHPTPPSPTPPGTFLIREDQLAAPILPKPLGKGKGRNKGLIKDFFSPLALETMFEPPSPRVTQDTLPAASSYQAHAHVAGEEGSLQEELDQELGDEGLGERDMEEETDALPEINEGASNEEDGDEDVILASDIPNLASFDGRKPSSAYKFTFSAARPTAVPSPVPEHTPSPSPAQAKAPHFHAPATDPRLRLFQFQYDTFTRDHLSAMVDSIAVYTPSDSSKSKSPASRLSRVHPHHQSSSTPEPAGDVGYLRATKRLKLSPQEDLSGNSSSVRLRQRRDYVGESRNLMQKIKQARTPSMMTTVSLKENIQPTNIEDQSTVEERPRRLPPGDIRSVWSADTPSEMSGSGRDPSQSRNLSAAYASSSLHPVYPTSTLTPSIPSSLFSSTSNSNSKPSSIASALGYRRQAADLMAQIRKDMTTGKRLVSLETLKDKSIDDGEAHKASTPQTPAKEVSQSIPTPHSHLAVTSRPVTTEKPPLLRKIPKPSPRKLLRRLSAADEVDRELAMNKSSSDISFRVSETAPPSPRPPQEQSPLLDAKYFPETSPGPEPAPSHTHLPSIQVFHMSIPAPNPTLLLPQAPNTGSDPSRVVSGGTTTSVETADSALTRGTSAMSATSVITGRTASAGSVASFVKHAGPVLMTRIGPEDLPSLPEMVGGMRYDRDRMRWVKVGRIDVNGDGADAADGAPVPEEEESDDPFRSFETLESGEGAKVGEEHAEEAATEAQVSRVEETREQDGEEAPEGTPAVVVGSMIQSTDDTDDSFEFDEDTGAAIVEVMTGVDSRDTETDTETTDSEADLVSPDIEQGEDDQSSEEDEAEADEDLTATIPAHDVVTEVSSNPVAATAPYTPIHPHRDDRPPPRSALKNGSGLLSHKPSVSAMRTPNNLFSSAHRRSVSFSDGRKDGKIKGLGRNHDEGNSTIEGPSPVLPIQESGSGNSFVPSMRGQRIAAILEDLAEPSFEDQTPSKASTSSRPPTGTIQPLVSRSQSQSVVNSSRRTFSRSTKEKELSLAQGNQTFLTECSFGVAHDKLVQVITDVHPYVPYWETLAQIDLGKRGIDSVARLKEFLPQLDALNLDANALPWLSGVPKTVRTLSVASNLLTALTSFNHLQNLENLDISHNQIDSLQQLSCLRHLRELKADGNSISSLDGLGELDGLTKLSLKGNQILHLDLEEFRWPRLELLNLSRNGLRSIGGLSSLYSLTALNLDHNRLESLEASRAMPRLRTLRVSDNRLVRLDTSRFISVRTLYADNNRLSDLLGAQRLRKLENLSLRNQGGKGLTLATYDIRDVKRLYLSGNPLSSSFIQEPCYNLIYLELAACRLTELPADLVRLIPNVRVLNLNYNFLTDAHALDGLTRLRKLTLIGSRLKGTKSLVRVLRRMPEIEMLDFRMNPCTLGWYLPILVQDVPGALQPSEDAQSGSAALEHKRDSGPGTRPVSGGGGAVAHSSWQELDAKFRRDLPDDVYVGRLAYRGLVMRACPKVRMLDGVAVEEREREKAERLLQGVLCAKGVRG